MAREALAAGSRAIMNFRYGQRAHTWWELVFTLKWDTESWYGTGEAVVERGTVADRKSRASA